jgi:hypothetical protein
LVEPLLTNGRTEQARHGLNIDHSGAAESGRSRLITDRLDITDAR